MTIHNQAAVYNAVATADLSAQSARFKWVTLAGTLYSIAAGASTGIAGVNITSARSGEAFTYQYCGIVKAVAGAVITTPGYPIQVASGGFTIAAVSGGMSIGRYWQTAACASGDLVVLNIDATAVGAWGGV
jgi:hypothetical protein